MAGAGYKLFNTGDVLTAAQVNTFLMEQTVMVFNDATARTAALSGVVAEGMLSYLKSTKQVEVYNGTAWVASDDPNAIQNTIVDAKGDLITATAADVPARLAVGANGETLVADSSTSTGLRWQGNFAAGKNFLINGAMDIWQRGTTQSFGAFDKRYLADRWYFFVGTANNTISQETTTVPAGARYALKWTSTGAGGTYGFSQIIETANTIALAGRTVTIQAQATGTTGKTVALYLFSSTNVDAEGTTVTTLVGNSPNVTLTSGTYTTVSLTVAVPSNVRTLRVTLTSGDTFANGETVTFGNAQLEVGNVATAFSRAGGTLAGELAACQRYYYRFTGDNNAQDWFSIFGAAYSTTNATIYCQHPVTMRVKPSSVEYANLIINRIDNGAQIAVNSLALNNNNPNQTELIAAGGAFLVNFAICQLRGDGSGVPFIGFSAEL